MIRNRLHSAHRRHSICCSLLVNLISIKREQKCPNRCRYESPKFCYHPAMSSTLRRFIVYLLLVLLPIQAMASLLTHSCAGNMPHCHEMKSIDGCCEHGKPSRGSHHVDATAHDGMSHNGNDHNDQHAASCGMGTTCAVIAPMAVLPSTSMTLPTASNAPPHVFVLSAYTSFISDGLQRPPQILA
jgi:hypothetical protein